MTNISVAIFMDFVSLRYTVIVLVSINIMVCYVKGLIMDGCVLLTSTPECVVSPRRVIPRAFISNWYDGVNVTLLWIVVVVYQSIFLLNDFKRKHLFFNINYCCISMWWLECQWHFWHVLLFAHLFCCVENKDLLGPVSIKRPSLPGLEIPMFKIRGSWDYRAAHFHSMVVSSTCQRCTPALRVSVSHRWAPDRPHLWKTFFAHSNSITTSCMFRVLWCRQSLSLWQMRIKWLNHQFY